MAESIGAVYVDVRPNADNFVTDLRGRIVPGMADLGRDAGTAFADAFRGVVDRELPDTFTRNRPATTSGGDKSGRDAGDAFGRALDTRITAAIRALPDITIDADSTDVDEKLFIIRQQLTELSGKNIGIDLSDKEALAGLAILRAQLDELTRPEHDISVRVDAKAALAELAAVQAEVDKLDKTPAGPKADTGSVGVLGPAVVAGIATLGPLAVLLGSGFAAAGAGAVTLALGVKGASAEMKAGTDIGKQYTSVVGQLKTDLQISEGTAAQSLFPSLNAATSDLQQRLPSITGEIQHLGAVGGDSVQHLGSALLGAFQSAEPLINQVVDGIDRGAKSLDAWANGGGLNKFVQWGEQNLPQIVKDLGQIGKLAVDLLESGADSGVAILNVLGTLSKDIDWLIQHVPGSASVLADLYLTMKAFQGLNVATAALKAFAAAEAEAGAAGAAGGATGTLGGLKGRAASILPVVGKAAIGLLGANLLVGQAANATSGGQYSDNSAYRGLSQGLAADKALLGGHFSQFGSIIANPNAAHDQYVAQYNAYQDALGNTAAGQQIGRSQPQQSVLSPQFQAPAITSSAKDAQLAAAAAQETAAWNKAWSASVDQVTKGYTNLQQQLGSTPLSQAASQYNQLQTSIQANVDQTDKFLKLGGPTIDTYHGITIGQKTLDAALQQTNGNYSAAVGLIHGDIDAINKNRDTINGLIVDQQRLGQFQLDVSSKFKLTSDQVDLYSKALGLNANEITANSTSVAAAEQVFGAFESKLANASPSVQTFLQALSQINTAAPVLSDKVAFIGAAFTALRGDALNMATTNLTAADGFEQLSTVIHDNSKSIGDNGQLLGQLTQTAHGWLITQPQLTAGSLAIAQAEQSAATEAVSLAQSILANTGNATDAAAAYNGLRAQFVSTQTEMLGSKDKAEALAKSIFGIPKDATTIAQLVQKNDMTGAIRNLTAAILGLNKTFNTTLNLKGNAQSNLTSIASTLSAISGTNYVAKVNIATSGTSPESLQQLLTGNLPPHKARGGFITEGTTPTADDVLILASKGEAVIPADQAAKHRSLVDALINRKSGFASGGFVEPSLYVPPAPSASAQKAAASQAASLAKVKITIDDSDIPKFLRSLGASASSIQSAESTLAKAVTSAGGGSALGNELANENTNLLRLADSRTSIANKLKTANTNLAAVQKQYSDEQSKVAAVFSGAFDITSAGFSPTQILSTLTGDESQAKLFQQQLQQVRALGLSKSLVQQFAEKGTSAEPALLALSRASKSQIAQINAGVSTLGGIGTSIGGDEASSLYGAGVAAAKGIVAGLQSQENAIAAEMKKIADTMVGQIKKDLGIHSPSQVMRELGAYLGQGMALGIRDSTDDVARATAAMTGSAIPGRGTGQLPAQVNFQINGLSDPVAAATAAERRILMLAG